MFLYSFQEPSKAKNIYVKQMFKMVKTCMAVTNHIALSASDPSLLKKKMAAR